MNEYDYENDKTFPGPCRSKVAVKTFIMLQIISVSNKHCSIFYNIIINYKLFIIMYSLFIFMTDFYSIWLRYLGLCQD